MKPYNKKLVFLAVPKSLLNKFSLFCVDDDHFFILRNNLLEEDIYDIWPDVQTINYQYADYDINKLNKAININYNEVLIFCRNINVGIDYFFNIIKFCFFRAKNIYLLDVLGNKKQIDKKAILLLLLHNMAIENGKKIVSLINQVVYYCYIYIIFFFTSVTLLIISPFIRIYQKINYTILKRSHKVCIAKRVISNQPYLLAKGLRELGLKADSVEVIKHKFEYNKCDYTLFLSSKNKYIRFFYLQFLYLYFFICYDVYIFSIDGESFFVSPQFHNWNIPELFQKIELIIYKISGKKVIFQMRDCAVYDKKKAIKMIRRNRCKFCHPKYENHFCQNTYYKTVTNNAIRYADKIIYSTADLANFLPKTSTWLPNAIEIYREVMEKGNGLQIIHSSTHSYLKATDLVNKVIRQLKRKYDFQYKVLTNKTQKEVKEILQNTDIVIGQFNAGAYGNFDIEAMMFKKPVIGYINPDFKFDIYKDKLPIISVDENDIENSLYDIIEKLINDPALRKQKGIDGYNYVEKVHSYNKVSKKLFEIINSL